MPLNLSRSLPLPRDGSGNSGHVGVAELGGRLCQRVEDRLQIECRAADDLEDVRGGSLLLQRVLCFVEQPHILDRNHSLIGEGFEELNLRV